MCGVKLSDKVACEELKRQLGLEDVVGIPALVALWSNTPTNARGA